MQTRYRGQNVLRSPIHSFRIHASSTHFKSPTSSHSRKASMPVHLHEEAHTSRNLPYNKWYIAPRNRFKARQSPPKLVCSRDEQIYHSLYDKNQTEQGHGMPCNNLKVLQGLSETNVRCLETFSKMTSRQRRIPKIVEWIIRHKQGQRGSKQYPKSFGTAQMMSQCPTSRTIGNG